MAGDGGFVTVEFEKGDSYLGIASIFAWSPTDFEDAGPFAAWTEPTDDHGLSPKFDDGVAALRLLRDMPEHRRLVLVYLQPDLGGPMPAAAKGHRVIGFDVGVLDDYCSLLDASRTDLNSFGLLRTLASARRLRNALAPAGGPGHNDAAVWRIELVPLPSDA